MKSQREDLLKFETGRIKALQEERLHIQKKTFTKWMNSFLVKARMEVEDLFTDLADGKMLLKLLEIISSEKLGKPNNGKMRVHKVENVNRSLAFLHSKVRLESIGAEDIVDGNPRLILGLIWTIILRFQIQEIQIEVDEDSETSEKKSAKEALLLWCQRKTNGYPHASVNDFSASWRSGMCFNALIHRHRPDLVDYNSLNPANHIENLNKAFDIAQRELGVPRLLDAEDIDTNKPDEKSIMTYVSSYYHTFVKREKEIKEGRRIANIIAQLMEVDSLKNSYENFTSNLLNWIKSKTNELDDRKFPNSLELIQNEMIKFKDYRTIEKPKKYIERIEIQALLFAIQTKIKSLGQPLYVPPEGISVHDIEKAWNNLEKAEHNREVALRDHLLWLEKLENLAFRFERKSVLREGYLKEMIQVLSDPRYGTNLSQVEATVKKHEAISADILARKERFESLSTMAQELIDGNFRKKSLIEQRYNGIMERWNHLLELLDQHKKSLATSSNLMSSLREVDAIRNEIKEVQKSLSLDDAAGAKHLSAIEDIIQKHTLLQAQITVQGETIKKLKNQALGILESDINLCREAPLLSQRLKSLNNEYSNLQEISKQKFKKLEEMRLYYQFVQDHEEEEAWIIERQRICQAVLPSKDLIGVISFQQKHRALEAEIKAHRVRIKKVLENGDALISRRYPEENDIRNRINELTKNCDHLHELAALKRKQLEDAIEAFQYQADANEMESWIKEKMQLVKSKDYGKDEPSAAALLQRHSRLEGEIKAYGNDIKRLNDHSEKMIKSGLASLFMICGDTFMASRNGEDEIIPSEDWKEEIIEKEVMQDVVEEVKIPQVKVLYQFKGKEGFEIAKNEILLLIQRTNSDWWNVRRSDGRDGFVPANYVKECEPKVVKVVSQRPVKVWEKQRVKKSNKDIKKSKRNSKRRLSIICDAESVEQRRKNINMAYEELVDLSKDRRQHLEDSIQFLAFNRECDNFEAWINEKESNMIETQKQHQQQMMEKQKKSISTISDPLEVLRKKFENFLSDLSANRHRLEEIDKMADEFTLGKQQHYSVGIRDRQKKIHDSWDRINHLRNDLGKNVEGLTSVDQFERTCDDAIDWMKEKLEKMEYGESNSRDLKTIQALQRRHDNLQRELQPIEEKINKVNLLADSVKTSFPSEKKNVAKRQAQLKELWEKLREKAIEKRSKLDESLGQQILKNSAIDLIKWCRRYVKQALANEDYSHVKDVTTAEMFIKNHEDLGYEIATKDQDFQDLRELGLKLMKQKPNEEIRNILIELEEEQNSMHQEWQDKDNWLKQCKDLMIFNQEADHLDTITNSHHTYLEFDDLGTTLDDVGALLKRHENFIATLVAQDERLHLFNDMAEKLINARHYNSANIDSKREQVIEKRNRVKELALQRTQDLKDAHSYQEFRAEADEFISWCHDKIKFAIDDSYKDLTNMECKLQRHEAFEAELASSHSRLVSLTRDGEQLVDSSHFSKEDIKAILKAIKGEWTELVSKTNERSKGLKQAIDQSTYNRKVELAFVKLDELEKCLASDELGTDLRACKDQIKKHKDIENDLSILEGRVNELVVLGKEISTSHFDGPSILRVCKQLNERVKKLSEPERERRYKLMESLKYHQFAFEIDTELQWIKDHELSAKSTDFGQSLTDVQSLSKKHEKLEREIKGHQSQIDKAFANGEGLISQDHFNRDQIKEKCAQLMTQWKNLLSISMERRKKLDSSLKAQTFFHEANEIETLINEKHALLSSSDFGKDEDAAVKLLTKHKATELEIDSYISIVKEMRYQATRMIENGNHVDDKIISNRMQDIEQQIKKLQQLSIIRRNRLIESKNYHEYYRETEDFMKWISEQMQTATSEEYGQDYEHLLLLHSKFQEFKRRVETCCERYKQCEEMCKKLRDSEIGGDVNGRQEELHNSWTLLLDHIESRDQQLKAAGELHRFNRDVAEARSRMQEKYSILNLDDLGKDLHSVQSLLRKHEGFENDLVALEAQLQVLIDDSARLQEAYPGGNAEHILTQREIVVKDWGVLQERATIRKELLHSSFELHAFIASIRDLERWCDSLGSKIGAQERVRDATGAQELKLEHESIKAEIEARESDFATVIKVGEALMKSGHYEEIRSHITRMLQFRDALNNAWQLKNVYLDQLSDSHCFLRDAKQLEQLSAQQEHYLSNHDLGETVEQVNANLKKHEAFDKLLISQEEKLVVLLQSGNKLLQQDHFDSENISKKMNELAIRRSKVKELSTKRHQLLCDQFLLAQFRRDVSEAESWIEDRFKQLESGKFDSNVTNLKDKVKQLQKHQAFQAEISANLANIKSIKQKGETLLSKRHEASVEVRSQLDKLMNKWSELLAASTEKSRGLEEAQDILEFENQASQAESWIRDKELLIQAGDVGKDYEHCYSLIRKLDDVDSNMRVDEGRIRLINSLADKLIRQRGIQECIVQKNRRDELNEKWRALQGSIESYRCKIQGALEVHRFNRDLDDLDERISEKMVILNKEDDPKSLEAVESLQRKQDAIECDVSAIETRLREIIDIESRRLMNKYPDMVSNCRTKLNLVQDNWRKLTQLCDLKRRKLSSAYSLHKFLTELKELKNWSTKLIDVEHTRASDFSNSADIKNELELHNERKAEIDGRQEVFKNLKDFAYKLLQQLNSQLEQPNHQLSSSHQNNIKQQGELIKSGLSQLDEVRNQLNTAWVERKDFLTQCFQLQLFYEQHEQAESWLSTKEAFLNNDDLADSISSVEDLIRKHDNFEKTMLAQNRIHSLEKYASELIANKHFDSDNISKMCGIICSRKEKLIESASLRRKKLQESSKYHQFLRNCHEVVSWLNEKIKIATDENYRDTTNLLSKIQKHAAFEAEMMANKNRIDAITNEGEAMIQEGHFRGEEIQANIKQVEESWRKLNEEAAKKKQRLQDAYQALQFLRALDDLDSWMNDVEIALTNEDHGKDIISCKNLLKKHQMLEVDVNNHAENIEHVKDVSVAYLQKNHFLKEEIVERSHQVIQRYSAIHEPVQIRRENLEDALVQHQFKRDVEDEMDWLNEKEPYLTNNDLGNSLSMVQNLQKRHLTYEAEITSREPLITALVSKGWNLIKSGHFASSEIEELIYKLQNKLQKIKDESAVKRNKLINALEAQQFYAEYLEASNWCKELMPIITCEDLGKDEDSALSWCKKMVVIERDIERYMNGNLEKLVSLGRSLIEKNNFESENIKKDINQIEAKFKEIEELFEKREEALNESKKRFAFLRDADELISWIKDQLVIASSEDYGQDVEHVELLIQRFDNFIFSLIPNKERVQSLEANAKDIIGVEAKVKEVKKLWDELEEAYQSRVEALAGAKQVHTFDRSADETIAWIHEKNSSSTLDESNSIGDDLESIQAMVRKHKAFESDLAAVREQVEALLEEASRLQAVFPDAKDHIEMKCEQVAEEWNNLLEKSSATQKRLKAAETFLAYFDEYRALMAWINEMLAMITTDEELASRDISGAEIQLNKHKHEYKAEINLRKESIAKFIESGKNIISNKHFMSDEVNEKVTKLSNHWKQLNDVWSKRLVIYEQNLDYLVFRRDVESLESWLDSKKHLLLDDNLGDNIASVEELIKKHEDFEKTVIAQEERLDSIKRITLIEQLFLKQKQEEEEMKKLKQIRQEQEKFDLLKKKEQKRILEERKKEDDKRKTHDVIISKPGESEGGFGFVKSLMAPKTVKRAESVKFNSQKRTPSFTTRRRSFRNSQSSMDKISPDKLPPLEIEGVLERKHELQSGGKRAAIRSWKMYYTVLCGQLLCFFKDKQSFIDSIAASSPVSILGAKCSLASDYTKKKHVFRLQLSDSSEYLFSANSETSLNEWLNKIAFHASLPPSMQLLSYDQHKTTDGEKNPQNTLSSSSPPPSPDLPSPDTFCAQPRVPIVSSRLTVLPLAEDVAETVIVRERANGPPPLPPPRTSTLSAEKEMKRSESEIYEKEIHTPSHRQSYPSSDNYKNEHSNEDYFINETVNFMPRYAHVNAVPTKSFRTIDHLNGSYCTQKLADQIDGYNSNLDKNDWILNYGQRTKDNGPLPANRHLSLSPNGPKVNTNTNNSTYRPSSVNYSEDDGQGKNRDRKKGNMLSFFKRNK